MMIMKKNAKRLILFCLLVTVFNACIFGETIKTGNDETTKDSATLILQNKDVTVLVSFDKGNLLSDAIIWRYENQKEKLVTDADFGLDMMWTDWQAPGKANNGDNPVILTKKDFKVTDHTLLTGKNRIEVELRLKGIDTDLELKITYSLRHGEFFARRTIALRDTVFNKHYLRKFIPLKGVVDIKSPEKDGFPPHMVKTGGFGQPIALRTNQSGAFLGIEYPASQNSATFENGKFTAECSLWMGEKIGNEFVECEPVVMALTPDSRVKYWFFQYLDHIRIAPLKPYTLYNSWYDLRAADYPSKTPTKENNVMNETNVMRMIGLMKKHMIDKHGIKMDAFVLDDGWDIYESDWALRKDQFPNGMKPIADELKKTGTDLGIWFGPTGGYSARMKRVDWMKNHGFEVVGEEKRWHNAMLCLGGKNYSELFKKRVTDFVKNDDVAYFKWDGIQFSCSEPDHGHAVGIHSRRAVLESLIDICRSVQEANPKVYLNITSGTWLSPWWLKYTNQIWMDGRDYDHADVPSISPRDSAITYRDFVLYEDFKNKDLWFPIANLMTHGIIKGHLQKLGGEAEPIDKFTDNALLYFARGVAMWELYISPDLLTDAEWNAIGKSINWAKDRFPILKNTVMIGGDPAQRSTYGYVHFKGKKGVIAARNPYIEPNHLKVKLSPAYGLEPDAASLVLERVYPTRWVSPELYSSGAEITLPLNGYETAVYEVYPVSEAVEPLLADVIFDSQKTDAGYDFKVYEIGKNAHMLNPEAVKSITMDGMKNQRFSQITLKNGKALEPVSDITFIDTISKNAAKKKTTDAAVSFTVNQDAKEAVLAVLLQHKNKPEIDPKDNSKDKNAPVVTIRLNGKTIKAAVEKQNGLWAWYTVSLPAGAHKANVQIQSPNGGAPWKGKLSMWVVCRQTQKGIDMTFEPVRKDAPARTFPPKPRPRGERVHNVKLCNLEVK